MLFLINNASEYFLIKSFIHKMSYMYLIESRKLALKDNEILQVIFFDAMKFRNHVDVWYKLLHA